MPYIYNIDTTAQLFFRTGTGNNVQQISMDRIKDNLKVRQNRICTSSIDHLCDALLGMHAFIGCDSISSFVGKGKVKGLQLVLMKDAYVVLFMYFGTWRFPDNDLVEVEKFVCKLYGHQIDSVNF